ncbi:N-acetylmuramoyl-L-alanine amidase [Inmirania thermothiophila]|uniref:N-acetylmuramoyl-L-alanine amidase AmiC n=2 Tax=Inmirania thermothiophila TaxID=1750597 RepID=A0A3N1XZJ5_9GAMM|nr:N-acetylmuramoyl-L-alanine amidase [Inmirania thermothiophila]
MLAAVSATAAPVPVKGLRLWAAPESTRLVFDLDAPLEHTVFTLRDPERVVIDLEGARLAASVPLPVAEDAFVRVLRVGERKGGTLRVVADLKRQARVRSFLLPPNPPYGHRLVVDLLTPERKVVAQASAPSEALRDIVVAVDAGHGGDDPGAIGHGRLREKDVVLAIARRLVARLEAEPGMRAFLVREGDYYVGLRERFEIARRARADLLVSIHADAFRDRSARGASVFVLSRRGASSEAAKWLADQENAADQIGGVSLEDKDETLRRVLLDLSQTGSLEASIDAARRVLQRLGRAGRLHSREVQRAGFVVLKAPDVPSMLVETGFITNPSEARRLRDPRHQERIAQAIAEGLVDYFRSRPPPGTRWAATHHVIRRGETLAEIARRYRVSVDDLRAANDLRGDLIRVGRVLRIPGAAVPN